MSDDLKAENIVPSDGSELQTTAVDRLRPVELHRTVMIYAINKGESL